MKISPDVKPRLPSHYYVLYEPPDDKGDEALIFISERRKVKFKGTLFREFQRTVMPLLDGQHTVADIEERAADLFPPGEVSAALELLMGEHILSVDAGEHGGGSARLDRRAPQLNFFHELRMPPHVAEARLGKATVSLLGVSGAGSLIAAGLAAAGVGRLRLLDGSRVLETDAYFDPIFAGAQPGQTRAAVVQQSIASRWPQTTVHLEEHAPASEDEIAAATAGSNVVICCADRGLVSPLYRLNRAAMRTTIPWISCAVSGFEVVVGPFIEPRVTPCYVCYTMRSVACSDEPEDEFVFQRFLDRRKQDDSGRRENLVFANGFAANLVGLEALKFLTAVTSCATRGALVIANLVEMTMKRHVVLRHPRCPVCFAKSADESAVAAGMAEAAQTA